nr:hypothetical protein [Malaciobacter halophilus]
MKLIMKIISLFIVSFLIVSIVSFVIEPRAIKKIYSWQEILK